MQETKEKFDSREFIRKWKTGFKHWHKLSQLFYLDF